MFEDAGVIALCKAIEASDLAEIERLVLSGVDVNARGRRNMTPLLWAFPDRRIERFRRLLELGADPNVLVTSNFGGYPDIQDGDAVTLAAARRSDPAYLQLVMQHGALPNLRNGINGRTPLIEVIATPGLPDDDRLERVRMLLDKGVDPNAADKDGRVPVKWACLRGRFEIARLLLERGADRKGYGRKQRVDELSIVQVLVRVKADDTMQVVSLYQEEFDKLVAWLEAHGESFSEAERDLQLHEESLRQGGNYLSDKRLRELEEQQRAAERQRGQNGPPAPAGTPKPEQPARP